MKEYVLLCLLAVCSAKPFAKAPKFMAKAPTFMFMNDMMLNDTEDDDDDNNALFPIKRTVTLRPTKPPMDMFPVCPFGCQCYLRVVQCSDLGAVMVACLANF